MIIVRASPAEGAEQQNLPRSRFQKIGSADDFSDLHRRIVDNDRQLIGRNVITPPYDEIAEVPASNEALPTKMEIGEGNFLAVRNAETPVHPGGLHRLCGP